MTSALQYNFIQNAIIGALLASIVCGIIGTIIIEKRLVMLSGGIAHASFGGIGLGYFLGVEPIITGLLFAIASALCISGIKRNTTSDSDALIGMFWSVGMAIGILFIAITPGYPPDMTSYLFGDILTISRSNILLALGMDVFILLSVAAFFNHWKAYLFDEEFSSVLGIDTRFLEYFLSVLVGMSVVILIKVVGIVLVIALLTIPPATASLFSRNLLGIMKLSIIIGSANCMLGLLISYVFNIPSGATIILVSSGVYFISVGARHER
ncbi:ABC-type Mn2+/Zn2+ transport systems, permeas e component [Peptoclostridium acidaminophilum DSM 3953]|uniref:ABC-type Mn2+/Zn2+ transport systems, permeas e component n=1 Tax=Peptoclostridium acidaminophilum DSM 3953 TaxID=1286171 RepID=W8T5K4_PEPAC|nr:metal ABC transporter permease [Peptoclostridium acidaminophilum]AHM57029.1 ABC-type Mn2+/Zn2+ transport systems, permeas e component [Peptoclostridium acidaminophilum DSM 3953]